ncbi:Exopolysaccharide biosynthesis protein Bme11 [Neorhizobium galegae bv. officinalis bv. officinalis str. HAMBI 1141]|uniref:Exopolysaccharide biosynthesis protein Bme11 n=1 Tax=Neorhizobium galegae bv. officinalis bv. officinalis str. HAMBI 1141 TaxID=1028801 RepID=A0A068TB35_NEOGA|nr:MULTISPECIES: polysaccharide biosynthesis/export family protein [Neorhizobium]MCJ9750995.1 polysaccharide biosynthesis/export family protein [Neorhizobium sp. BETTINA12A]CDN55722.1 Exopolysaccharide biosynthesis protein Bme11 [Neorhizobium galegae bv. officinalis bv. officinalis str. HAMBI 1141]
MRGITSLAGLLLCLTFGDVAAQTAYRLQPGDTLQVWIAQEPELTREVVIAPDGWLSFPLAGHIQSAGLSLSELEAQLLDRLKTYFNDKPNLTIMLRPNTQNPQLIYVLGEVATPGAYPYRANMTVLHGLSVAGGVYRTALLAADQDRSVIVRRDVEHSQKRLQELKARIVRLEAELRGEKSIGTTEALAADPALAQEQSLLNARMEALSMEEKAQAQANQLTERNSLAMQEQVDTMTKRIDLAKRRLQSITGLVAKGVTEGSQQMVQEGTIAELEGQISRLTSEIAVAERTKMAELARYDSARQAQRTQLLVELNAAQREQEETAARLADSTRIMTIYGESAASSQQRERRQLGYHVVRTTNGETREFVATEMTPILPGDLLRVVYTDPTKTGDAGAGQPVARAETRSSEVTRAAR